MVCFAAPAPLNAAKMVHTAGACRSIPQLLCKLQCLIERRNCQIQIARFSRVGSTSKQLAERQALVARHWLALKKFQSRGNTLKLCSSHQLPCIQESART